MPDSTPWAGLDLENSPQAAVRVSAAGVVRACNQAARARFEPQLSIGEPLEAAFPGLDPAALAASPDAIAEASLKDAQRPYRFIAVSEIEADGAQPDLVVLITPAQIDAAHPLDSSQTPSRTQDGKLNSAFALDLNNVLTAILGHSSHLKEKVPSDHDWSAPIRDIYQASERAAELAYLLSDRSHDGRSRGEEDEDLQGTIQQAADALVERSSKRLIVTTQFEATRSLRNCDPKKLRLVIDILLTNAEEAADDHGAIQIRTRDREIVETGDAEPTAPNQSLPAGQYVALTVTNSGSDIAEGDRKRIFEPFFTTKPNHKGLGLTMAWGMVMNEGGALTLEPPTGKGTSFTILFPAGLPVRAAPLADHAFTDKKPHVMVVDDEPLILEFIKEVLLDEGYLVTVTKQPDEALAIMKSASPPIDLMITDIVMPNLSGHQLGRRIRKRFPSAKILNITGLTGQTPTAMDHVLRKPFTSRALVSKVKKILTDPSASIS